MADQVVGIKINVEGADAGKSVGSLKSQLREAQAEVATLSEKFGATSAAAVNAAKKAAELKDAIGDAKALTEAFNPDRKFQAFSSAISGVVGGFAALQGAQALFGAESEDLQKVLVKVQAAMALSQGINSILEARDSFKILKIVVIDTMAGIKAAIGSTGIGLLAVAIGAIVYSIKEWYDSTTKQVSAEEMLKRQEEALRSEIKKTNDEIDNRNKINAYLTQVEVTNAKARGANLKELRKIEDDFFNAESIRRYDALQQQITNFEEISKSYSTDSQIYKDALAQKDKIANDFYILNQQRNIQLANRNLEDFNTKQALDKQAVEKEKLKNETLKQGEEELRRARYETRLAGISDEDKLAKERLRQQYKSRILEIENSKYNEQIKADLLLEAKRKFQLDSDKLDEEAAKKKKEANDKWATDEVKRMADEMDAERKKSEEKIKLSEEEAKARIDAYNSIGDALGALGDLIGQQTAAGKALAIAQAIINTWTGATEVLRAKSVLPEPLGTISKIANVAAIVATGIKAVKNITATKVPGGGGSGGNTVSNLGVTAPVGMAPSNTLLNQQLINQQGNAAVRSFVLESDVSGNQERIRRLNRAARIN